MTETISSVPFELRVDAWLLVLGLGFGYWWAWQNIGPRSPGFDRDELVGRRRLFFGGLLVLAVAVSWPIDTIGDGYLFSVHMTQYLVMSFGAAPLLVAGTPGWMLVALTQPFRGVLERLTHPVVSLLLFNVVLVLSHWPAFVDVYLRVDAVHFGMHTLWVVAAVVFWIPLINRAPQQFRKLSPPLQMVYLFLSSVVPTVPASFLTWAESPLYPAYAAAPRMWGMSAVEDMQAAAAVMKVGGGVFLWTLIVVIFFRWAATQGDSAPPRVPRAARS